MLGEWMCSLLAVLIAVGAGACNGCEHSALQASRVEARFARVIADHLDQVPDPAMDRTSDLKVGRSHDAFRAALVRMARSSARGDREVNCPLGAVPSSPPFRVVVGLYHSGDLLGIGDSTSAELCSALHTATRRSLAAAWPRCDLIFESRFAIELPGRGYSLVEYDTDAHELDHGLIPVRSLDAATIRQSIAASTSYLLRMIDESTGGVHKYYYARTDTLEPRVHTIYTASTVFTLLKAYQRNADPELLKAALHAADFLLAQQSMAANGPTAGGFHYSYDLEAKKREDKLVVGTAAKTIFTLLWLHRLTHQERYLDAAQRAGSWLLSMQQSDGRVSSLLRRDAEGGWIATTKESLLYQGQVLSALSRLFLSTGRNDLRDGAARIAGVLLERVAAQGCYLGDDYRKPNPISSSWVILSLWDYLKATDDAGALEATKRCASDLLGRQIRTSEDLYRRGRWRGSLSSSGVGWLAEVYSELYAYCLGRPLWDCDELREAVIEAMRQLVQNTYTPENAYLARNPRRARGGLFWTVSERYVRTDAVCHAMNAYLNMLEQMEAGVLIAIPEAPLQEALALPGDRSQRR
jgi:hypothetical protein